MGPDEERVKGYLEDRELTAERFSKADTRAGKTPDFRVFRNGGFQFYANDGTAHPIYRQFSHGRIKDEKRNIHLFIWLDDHNSDLLLFSQTDEAHHAALCNTFGVHPHEFYNE